MSRMGAGTLTNLPPTAPPALIDTETAAWLEMFDRLHQRGRRVLLALGIKGDNRMQFPSAGCIGYTHVIRRSWLVFFVLRAS